MEHPLNHSFSRRPYDVYLVSYHLCQNVEPRPTWIRHRPVQTFKRRPLTSSIPRTSPRVDETSRHRDYPRKVPRDEKRKKGTGCLKRFRLDNILISSLNNFSQFRLYLSTGRRRQLYDSINIVERIFKIFIES